jgi:hypothetical protein
MRFFVALTFAAFAAACATDATTEPSVQPSVQPVNGCVSFTVGAGTGCAWMCNYCAGALGTNNYYFTTDVCKYEEGAGCVGNPQSGVTYTCCAAATNETEEEEDAESCETESESADEWVEHITEIRITETRRRTGAIGEPCPHLGAGKPCGQCPLGEL